MALEINFLPEELKPKGYALKLSKQLRKVAYVCLSFFFVSAVLFASSTILFNIQQRKANSESERLKTQIKALEETEQRLVLAQDRLGKIDTIRTTNDAKEEVAISSQVLGKDLQNILVSEIELTQSKAKITVVTNNSSSLTRFFSQLIGSNYKNIRLESFEFDKDKGYEVGVSISN